MWPIAALLQEFMSAMPESGQTRTDANAKATCAAQDFQRAVRRVLKREMGLLLTILRIAQYPAFDLISPLPRDECVRRLRENTNPPGWKVYMTGPIGPPGGVKIYDSSVGLNPKPLIGYIGESDLRIAQRIGDNESSQTRLFAEIVDDGGMTRLHCFVGIHPGVAAFWAFWFISVFLAGITSVLRGDDSTLTIAVFWWQGVFRGAWTAWVGTLLMLAAGLGLFIYFRYLARKEDKSFLIDFVRKTLEAQKV
jgi:hypothetical protein